MLNIRKLVDLRTKEELINYFKTMGKNITEEEIEALKLNYEQTEENSNTLTMQQLDDVAGGLKAVIVTTFRDILEDFMQFVNKIDPYKYSAVDPSPYDKNWECRRVTLFVNDNSDNFLLYNTYVIQHNGEFYILDRHSFVKILMDDFNIDNEKMQHFEKINDFLPTFSKSQNPYGDNSGYYCSGFGIEIYDAYIDHLKRATNKDLPTLESEIPGLQRFRIFKEAIDKKQEVSKEILDYILHPEIPVNRIFIDPIIDQIIDKSHSKFRMGLGISEYPYTPLTRANVFKKIYGLQELYDRATGLSKVQRNALAAGFGSGFMVLAGVAVGLSVYFSDKDKN